MGRIMSASLNDPIRFGAETRGSVDRIAIAGLGEWDFRRF
jgi:hypothetical protein